jgi:hypothetical protein
MALPAIIPFTQNGASLLPPRQAMSAGQYLLSPSGSYKLLLQPDGNLAIYDLTTGAAVWVANASQPYSNTVAPTGDALNFYVSNSAFLNDPLNGRQWIAPTGLTDEALWTRTHVSLQNDSNLVILDIQALWASNTSIPFTPGATEARVVNPNVAMQVDAVYPAGSYKLIFQGDGNLVVYDQNMTPTWFSGTANVGATQAVMQGDGNFVISNAAGQPIWYTGTGGFPGAYAQIQNNGNFVICYEKPLWARFGYTPTATAHPVFYPDHSTGPFPLFGGIGWDY